MICLLALLAALTLHGNQAPLDGATIVNSGSTNAVAWTVTVRSDGSAQVRRAGRQAAPFSAPVALALSLLRDVRLARSSSATGRACMKSVSFGSRLNVVYHGWESPDLSCPPDSPLLSALASDVSRVVALANVAPAPLRRIRLPFEPRRVPTEAPTPPGVSRARAQGGAP